MSSRCCRNTDVRMHRHTGLEKCKNNQIPTEDKLRCRLKRSAHVHCRSIISQNQYTNLTRKQNTMEATIHKGDTN